MTTIHQLNPPFHLWIPEAQDHGLALFLIDYHVEEHLYWVCAMQKTGEIWMLSNDKVRADVNRSIGRTLNKDSWQLQDPKDNPWTNTWKDFDKKVGGVSSLYANKEPESRGTSNSGLSRLLGQQVPVTLRVREPKVHLDVSDASGGGEGTNPHTKKVNDFLRKVANQTAKPNTWWRTDNDSTGSGKAKRRKGPHKAKHSRRTKSKS